LKWKLCAATRCGRNDKLADFPAETQAQALADYETCKTQIISNECVSPKTYHNRFLVRNHDFVQCLKHKRCGPRPNEDGITTEVMQNCQCLASGFNNAEGLTTPRQMKVDNGSGSDVPYSVKDCPNVPASEMNNTGTTVSVPDTLAIVLQKAACLANNKKLHDHCDVTIMDKVYVNPIVSSDTRSAKCTCTVEASGSEFSGQNSISASTIVHYIGQPVVGSTTANAEAQVCKGGEYQALGDESDVGTYSEIVGGTESQVPYKWKSHVVECHTTPQHVCPPHN